MISDLTFSQVQFTWFQFFGCLLLSFGFILSFLWVCFTKNTVASIPIWISQTFSAFAFDKWSFKYCCILTYVCLVLFLFVCFAVKKLLSCDPGLPPLDTPPQKSSGMFIESQQHGNWNSPTVEKSGSRAKLESQNGTRHDEHAVAQSNYPAEFQKHRSNKKRSIGKSAQLLTASL